jgi:hypothetical protein
MDPVASVLIGIAVPLLIALGLMAARRPALTEPTTGATILRQSWVYKGLAIAGFGLFLVIFFDVLTRPGIRIPNDLWPTFVIFGIALVCGLMVLDGFRTQIALHEEGVISYTPWRGTRSFRWSEIEKVTFSYMGGWFTITGPNRRKIRVSMWMVGIRSLADSIRRHLPPERYRKAQGGFEYIDN